MKERRAKEVAELTCRRLQSDLHTAQGQVADITQQLAAVQRSKDNLETELERDLADRDFTTDQTRKKYQGLWIAYILLA